MANDAPSKRIRLDKWLWAARFYKTRSLAMEAIHKGRVSIADHTAKPGRDVQIGDRITVRETGGLERVVEVMGLSDQRGPAPVAQQLYAETPASLEARTAAIALRKMGVEPGLSTSAGRPTKRDRRERVDWERWSAVWSPESDSGT